jgi:ABC-type polar amino acid transport system ATPase subunit
VGDHPAIRISRLYKSYGESLVLHDVSMDVFPGEVTAIIGPSGCGKTTLLRCMGYLETPDSGEILINGRDPQLDGVSPDELRKGIGVVFQELNLFPHLTALDNITLAPIRVKGLRRQEAEQNAMNLLGKVGLSDKEHAYPDELSGGQQQRLAIARALALNPKVLLLDEITSALDPTLVAGVQEVIADLARNGATMVVVTHDFRFAAEVATEVVFLSHGEIVEQGPARNIFEDPKERETRDFVGRHT